MKYGAIGLAIFYFMTLFLYGEEVPKDILLGLSDEEFRIRENAERKLAAWLDTEKTPALKAVKALADGSDDPEVRNRCLTVLKMMSDRSYLRSGSGYLGIQLTEQRFKLAEDDEKRVVIRVLFVVPQSPADQFGLLPGDLILELNRRKWDQEGASENFRELIAARNPLEEVSLLVQRGNDKPHEIKIRLGKRPEFEGDFEMSLKPEIRDKMAKERFFEAWLENLE
ncbi:PDZ domain-containing protein [Luteolibacter algae]|uniref:PDZ domain-containing protein n=1 Tax=Luteolibacter algae TaxID=454151 RepID=A0ABW5D6M9_9BACT